MSALARLEAAWWRDNLGLRKAAIGGKKLGVEEEAGREAMCSGDR
jgi:hypothetical protein